MLKRHFAKSLLFLNFIFTLHYTVNSYINSSFLEQYIPISMVGFLFTIAAIIAIFALSQAEKILVRFGGLWPTLILIIIDSLALFGLTFSRFENIFTTPYIPVFLFIVHYTIAVFMLRFAFDVFYEKQSTNDGKGFIRGEILTAANLAWVISPFIFAKLIGDVGQFWKVYAFSFLSSLVLLVLCWMVLPHGKEPQFKKIFFFATLKEVYREKDILRVFLTNFLLHFFFAWMIIYLPIYLHEHIGFSWQSIGTLLTIMLVPYILIDIPLGVLADKYFGEKELLAMGFIIMIIFTFPIGAIATASFALWALVLFFSRVGAAIVEVMAETYFFKKIKPSDANLISFFRNAQPFAYVASPVLGSLFLFLGVTPGYLFMILSALMILGVFYSSQLTDTL